MTRPFFPLLFAVYPVMFIAVANPGQVSWQSVITAVGAAGVASTMLLTSMRVALKTWNRAALATAVIIVVFYAYGPVHTYLDEASGNPLNEISGVGSLIKLVAGYLHVILTAVSLVTAFMALRAVQRIPEHWIPRAVQGCNVAAVVIVGFVCLQWTAQQTAGADDNVRLPGGGPSANRSGILDYDPDIYTIVLDGYARADVLKERYRFDNSAFLEGLRSRGFQVSDASNANYNWTFLSLASTLNMQYLEPLLGDRISTKAMSRAPVYDAVRKNAVAGFLKERGYRIVHFQTTWGATLHNPYADQQIACHRGLFVNEFYRVIAQASWLKALNSKASVDLAECHLSNLESLSRMGSEPGPKFVFAHFLPPHHPYLFDRQGNILRNANLSDQFQFQLRLWEEKAKYLDQLVFMNRRITTAVDAILKTSPKPPIIIIQSDHGPNLTDGLTADERVLIRLANLSAYLLPAAPTGLIPQNVSPVNEFRYILNYYFKENREILPNRYYFSNYGNPYELKEVNISER